MKEPLTALEARVIGSLIEKQLTTPDQYPLSLNALTNACNQKSNRDPLLNLAEREVQTVVDGLVRKSLLMEKSGFGSRVPKYQQRFCNLEFSEHKFTPVELAIVCELLLRGPQTPGELRTRAARMAPISDVAEVEAALQALAARDKQPLVQRLAREPGRRDARYAQLFTGAVAASLVELTGAPGDGSLAESATSPAGVSVESLASRIAQLEDTVRELQRQIEALQAVAAR